MDDLLEASDGVACPGTAGVDELDGQLLSPVLWVVESNLVLVACDLPCYIYVQSVLEQVPGSVQVCQLYMIPVTIKYRMLNPAWSAACATCFYVAHVA